MKIAVVTGCSKGIGRAVCELLLKNQYKVYGVSRTDPGIKVDNFKWIKFNLIEVEKIKNLVKLIDEVKVDVLINNAGVVIKQKALAVDNNNYGKIFDLNFKAPIFLTAALKNKLDGGMVINISSLSDRYPDFDLALYSSSKAALNIFFDTMALENKHLQIINILPDYVDTPLLHDYVGDEEFDWTQAVDAGQVAQLIGELAEDKYKLQSGSRIAVNNNASIGSLNYQERLWSYNTDSKRLEKISR